MVNKRFSQNQLLAKSAKSFRLFNTIIRPTINVAAV